MNNQDDKKPTFWGASPIVFLFTILYSMAVILINYFLKPVFQIDFIPHRFLITLALVLLAAGIPPYFMTLLALKKAFKQKKLLTSGIFSICRNPLFAEVTFFILPGILLFFDSWLLLTIPFFLYGMFKIFIKREESLMEREFGQDYIEYKRNTSAIFPKFWKYKKVPAESDLGERTR